MSVNKVILIGNLGADPELRYTQGGQAVCTFRIATKEVFGGKDARQERTEWHRIVAWGRTGELVKQYLVKGRQVYVEGRLQTRKWTNKEGHDQYTTEIVAREVKFIDSRKGEPGGQQADEEIPLPDETTMVPAKLPDEDDIPF